MRTYCENQAVLPPGSDIPFKMTCLSVWRTAGSHIPGGTLRSANLFGCHGQPSQICFARGDAPPHACRRQAFVVASCGSSMLSLSSPPVPSSWHCHSSGFASLRSASLVAVAPRDMPSPVGSGMWLASLATLRSLALLARPTLLP
jgi:hypothetical protein